MSYDIGIHSQVIVICMCYQGVKSRASKCFDKDYIHVYKSWSPKLPPILPENPSNQHYLI